jgi:hypothetical protein
MMMMKTKIIEIIDQMKTMMKIAQHPKKSNEEEQEEETNQGNHDNTLNVNGEVIQVVDYDEDEDEVEVEEVTTTATNNSNSVSITNLQIMDKKESNSNKRSTKKKNNKDDSSIDDKEKLNSLIHNLPEDFSSNYPNIDINNFNELNKLNMKLCNKDDFDTKYGAKVKDNLIEMNGIIKKCEFKNRDWDNRRINAGNEAFKKVSNIIMKRKLEITKKVKQRNKKPIKHNHKKKTTGKKKIGEEPNMLNLTMMTVTMKIITWNLQYQFSNILH